VVLIVLQSYPHAVAPAHRRSSRRPAICRRKIAIPVEHNAKQPHIRKRRNWGSCDSGGGCTTAAGNSKTTGMVDIDQKRADATAAALDRSVSAGNISCIVHAAAVGNTTIVRRTTANQCRCRGQTSERQRGHA
jgi:hypothetical protein